MELCVFSIQTCSRVWDRASNVGNSRDWQVAVWRFGALGAPNRRPNRHQQAPTGTNRQPQQAPRGTNGFKNRQIFGHQWAPRGSPTGTNRHQRARNEPPNWFSRSTVWRLI